jgi:hypothetical protein
MKITFISDTHTKHEEINKDLPGGDLIIHAGDFMNSGYEPQDVARVLLTGTVHYLQWITNTECLLLVITIDCLKIILI